MFRNIFKKQRYGPILIISLIFTLFFIFYYYNKNSSNLTHEIEIETKCNYGENGPRILCAIYTHSLVHKTTLLPVHNTWAKRCDRVIYMTGPKINQDDDPTMPFVYLNITDHYQRITDKTLKTMEYIHDHLLNEFDWLVRANDDTYIIIENLRLFLANKCSDEKIIYGKLLRHFKYRLIYNSGNNSAGFIQGGSGFLISRESLRLFVSSMKASQNKFCEMIDGSKEDQEISNCFRKLNIYPGETRDHLMRQRFFNDKFNQLWSNPSRDSLDYDFHHIPLVDFNLLNFLRNFFNLCLKFKGKECCSNTAIGFHNVKNEEQYFMDYLLYNVHPKKYKFAKKNWLSNPFVYWLKPKE